ncbi:hypothetical protein ES703_91287 [subsurface metagenome]
MLGDKLQLAFPESYIAREDFHGLTITGNMLLNVSGPAQALISGSGRNYPAEHA